MQQSFDQEVAKSRRDPSPLTGVHISNTESHLAGSQKGKCLALLLQPCDQIPHPSLTHYPCIFTPKTDEGFNMQDTYFTSTISTSRCVEMGSPNHQCFRELFPLERWFSNHNGYTWVSPETCSDEDYVIVMGLVLKFCISYKLPGNENITGPRMTLPITRPLKTKN